MKKYRLILRPHSALLIGGQTSSPLVDVATARLPSGLPIIPASAIKGALRCESERLARLAQEKGYIGADPKVCNAGRPESACGFSNVCIVCSMFGSPGVEGKLRVHDAKPTRNSGLFVKEPVKSYEPEKPTGLGFTVRPGVAISRQRKTAVEKLLFAAETLSPFLPDCIFEAELEVLRDLTEEEYKLLAAATGNLTGIGGGKSRGLGRVEVVLEELNDPAKDSTELVDSERALNQDLIITLTPVEYVRVSRVKVATNFLDTFDFIPGSAVRGAVAGAFAASLPGGWQDDQIKEAFLKRPVLFTNFYPTTVGIVLPKPIPLSARTCKAYEGFTAEYIGESSRQESHGTKDILIASTVVKFLRDAGLPALLDDKCKYCDSPLKEISGYYLDPLSLAEAKSSTRMTTKTAMNRARMTSAEEQLYSYELIDTKLEYGEGARPRFIGALVNLTDELCEFVRKLHGQTLLIGGARSRGFGKVKVEVRSYREGDGETEGIWRRRMQEFTRLIREALESQGMQKIKSPSTRVERQLEKLLFFSLTLTSDVILPPGVWEERLLKDVATCLKIGDENLGLEKVIARVSCAGGYSEALGMQKDLVPSIMRGSVFVLSCPADSKNLLVKNLPDLLKKGIGVHREEGFGRVSFCDEFHLKRMEQR